MNKYQIYFFGVLASLAVSAVCYLIVSFFFWEWVTVYPIQVRVAIFMALISGFFYK